MKEKKIISLKKWSLLILLTFLFLVLQSSEIFTIFNKAKPVLIFPFAISCSLFLKKEESAIFSIICGFFLDCFSSLIFGFSSIVLLFFFFFNSLIIKKYIRICLINIILLNFFTFLIYCFIVFTFKYLTLENTTKEVWTIWLYQFIPNVIYTTFSSIFIFLLCKKMLYNSKMHVEKYAKKNIKQKRKKYEKNKK